MLKTYKIILFFLLISVISHPSFSQESTELLKQIERLQTRVSNLSYSFDQLNKKIEDVNWYNKVGEIAYVDKVRMTGPPAKIKSKTAKGAGNPLVFWSYVFIPKDFDPGKKYPLIVLVHGGVHGNFGVGNDHIVKEFISQGYIVSAPEYRGSTGYGRSFQRKIDYGGLEIDDTKACRDYMVENYDFVDSSRVGVVGWSHGGFHALLNVFNFPKSYAVAYAGVPVSDLVMRLGYMDDDYRKLFSADYHIGKEVKDDVKEYRRRSPAFQAHKLQTPLLIHANTNDDDVLIEEVEHLISALKANNKKFEYEIYENKPGGHHFDRIDSYLAKEVRLKAYKFLQQYLKPDKPFANISELIRASYYPPRKK
ncbi:S9 family peptidase [Parapedobacter sp. SGR-10]|uniref:alpha/beta hydrolase family protein n=1 Tax=Parapedobacter sp. SGR-10 TaxID=2710879 RepID=UPI0013D54FF8|nr:prolyl oligopeptidase family serine peptidase [Parapedobacter sp. SGR-10]NGF57365.1 S9 family peptidase [Parapedobacter sp. SGR-10]